MQNVIARAVRGRSRMSLAILLAVAVCAWLLMAVTLTWAADSAQSMYIESAQSEEGVLFRQSRVRTRHGAVVRYARATGSGASLSGVYGPLAAKAREIASACGSHVISGVRHTRVHGTGRLSLHASGHAVDMRGSPRCIYAHLRGWPGGVSIDYGRVQHVHFSLGGSEDGVRFAHGGHRKRHAHRRIRLARR